MNGSQWEANTRGSSATMAAPARLQLPADGLPPCLLWISMDYPLVSSSCGIGVTEEVQEGHLKAWRRMTCTHLLTSARTLSLNNSSCIPVSAVNRAVVTVVCDLTC